MKEYFPSWNFKKLNIAPFYVMVIDHQPIGHLRKERKKDRQKMFESYLCGLIWSSAKDTEKKETTETTPV